jgi:hypothetical protein
MGGRDFSRREKKKPKKDSKKQPIISSILEISHPNVEVIRKGKKAKGEEEEEE